MRLRNLAISTAVLALLSWGAARAEAGFVMYVSEAGNGDIYKID